MQHRGPNMIPAAAAEQIPWWLLQHLEWPCRATAGCTQHGVPAAQCQGNGAKRQHKHPSLCCWWCLVFAFFFSMFSAFFPRILVALESIVAHFPRAFPWPFLAFHVWSLQLHTSFSFSGNSCRWQGFESFSWMVVCRHSPMITGLGVNIRWELGGAKPVSSMFSYERRAGLWGDGDPSGVKHSTFRATEANFLSSKTHQINKPTVE